MSQATPCEIRAVIRAVLRNALNLHPSESVLILADEPMQEMALAFFREARYFSRKSFLLVLPEIERAHKEPPRSVTALMMESRVVILLTSRSLSHTTSRRKAIKNGARIAGLPGVTAETLIRCLNGDQKKIAARSRKLADILTIGRSAQLTTPAGTELTLSISRMRGYADTGIIHEPGQFSNLPAGEGCVGPVHGSAQGRIVVDGSFPGIGKIETPFEMRVRDGYVSRITGSETAERVRKLIQPYGHQGRNIAELGIGTNPRAKLMGLTLEDEKTEGTVHVALGNNVSFDGKVRVPCHFDAVLLNPTLLIDGNPIIRDGVILV
ncbi:MAG TPA: aminopeptidase [bacterium]|nr:aminopeptidase [bacterium]